jgi:hypothetical protein
MQCWALALRCATTLASDHITFNSNGHLYQFGPAGITWRGAAVVLKLKRKKGAGAEDTIERGAVLSLAQLGLQGDGDAVVVAFLRSDTKALGALVGVGVTPDECDASATMGRGGLRVVPIDVVFAGTDSWSGTLDYAAPFWGEVRPAVVQCSVFHLIFLVFVSFTFAVLTASSFFPIGFLFAKI